MKKYHNFTVEVVANGFIAKIGCQKLVFKTMQDVAMAVSDYAEDPSGAAAKILENSFVGDIIPQPAAPEALEAESTGDMISVAAMGR